MKIIYKKKEVEIPGDLEELNPEQYFQYLELVIMLNMGTITPYEMKCMLLSKLLGLKTVFTMYRESVVKELSPQVDNLNSFFDINEADGVFVYDPHIKTGKNMLPTWEKWTGPEDMLNDITFGQFIACLNCFASIADSYQHIDNNLFENEIANLGSILYKHSDFGHEAATPLLLNFHAYYFFSSVWELIRTVPIPINGKNIDFGILFQETEGPTKLDDKTGWTGISYEIATSGVFGNTRQVKRTGFWDVLIYLYKCRFEQLHTKKTES